MKHPRTHCRNGHEVVSWYDRGTRSWVTQDLDAERNQVGDADYAGYPAARDAARAYMIAANGGASGLRYVEVKPDPATLMLAMSLVRPREIES